MIVSLALPVGGGPPPSELGLSCAVRVFVLLRMRVRFML